MRNGWQQSKLMKRRGDNGENKDKKIEKRKVRPLVCNDIMDLIHYSFVPLILFCVPYMINLLL